MLCSLYALRSNVGSCAQAFGRVDVLCFQIAAARLKIVPCYLSLLARVFQQTVSPLRWIDPPDTVGISHASTYLYQITMHQPMCINNSEKDPFPIRTPLRNAMERQVKILDL
jgi:hypothetical protein